MNKKFSTMIRNPWMNRLLALTVCASMLLSSVAARPLVNSSADVTPSPTETPLATTPVESVTSTAEPSTAVPTTDPAAATPTTPTTNVTPEPTQPAPEKPAVAVATADPKRVNFRQIIFQFTNESGVSLNAQGLSAQSGADITSVQNILKDSVVKPVFSGTGNTPASAQSVNSSPNVYYYAQLPESVDVQTASQILESLKQDPSIELAYMEPVYLPATAALPIAADLTDQQGYLDGQDATHNGINAKYAWTQTDGTGLGMRVYDIEGGWQIGHEDLNIHDSSLINSLNSSQQDWVDHGTAVLGEIAGLNNSFGITGIAYDAELWLLSNVMDASLIPRPLASAIDIATTNARPGDVIVLPLQALGPVSGETCTCPDPQCNDFEAIPVEYWDANFDAIAAATAKGIIVVEAAGNGTVNLNDTVYQDRFNRSKRDSGALLVGAGTSDTRAPMCLSNYGTRLDLQGWGDSIVTTGYGDLAGADPTEFYTEKFGGTSGAAAMVAGAVASLQGVAKKRGYLLDSTQVLDALKDTGTPQGDPLTTKIGPLPDLQRAIDERLPQQIQLVSPVNGDTLYTLRPTLDWADYYNATRFEIQVTTGSTFSPVVIDTTTTNTYYTIPSNLSKVTYWWRVRPMVDTAWRSWSTTWSFTLAGSSVPAPSLLSPTDKYVSPVVDPLFKWKAPSSPPAGYKFELQISTLADFLAGPDTITIPVAATETNPVLVENARYYWRVRGYVVVSGNNNYSAWTSPRIIYTALPPVANLNDPADGTDPLPTLRPLFTWDAVTDARSYRLDIATDSSFSSSKIWKAINISMPSGETIVPNQYQMGFDLPRNKTMYWRVRVLGLYGWSGWGDPPLYSSFRTGSPADIPIQTSPANKAVINDFDPAGPTLKWSASSGGPVSYEVEVFDTHDFTLPPFFTDAPSVPDHSSVVSALAPDSIYYWHVRSVNMDSVFSNWSSMRIFYTTPLPPENLIDPADGADAATVGSLKPTFNWKTVDVASSYKLQIAKDDLFTKVVVSTVIITSPPYTLTTSLSITSSPYYWRVSAGGLYGYSKPSEIFSFYVPNPPGTPELVYPVNGAVLSTFAPVLDWNKSPTYPADSPKYADEYQVQVATSSGFDPNPAITVIDKIVLSPETKYAIGAADLPTAGIYYWRVRAHNVANDFYSTWSVIRSFTTPPWVDGTIEDMSATGLEAVTLQIAGTTWSTQTDSSGVFNFKGLPAGNYDMFVSKNGFIRQVRNITISAGKMLDLNLNMVEIPPAGTITIMLTWNKSPEDLDAHLWLPATAAIPPSLGHISKDNLGGLGAFPDALLSGNVIESYGMEVITIDALFPGVYQYAVYLNGTSNLFTSSQARVVVYDGSTLIKSYLVPTSGSGNWWKVFKIDGPTRSIIDQNVITSKNPQLYLD